VRLKVASARRKQKEFRSRDITAALFSLHRATCRPPTLRRDFQRGTTREIGIVREKERERERRGEGSEGKRREREAFIRHCGIGLSRALDTIMNNHGKQNRENKKMRKIEMKILPS